MIGERGNGASGHRGAQALARELREQREVLRSVETAALANTAEILVGVASALADLVERVEKAGGRNFRTEELAEEMGYVDEGGSR